MMRASTATNYPATNWPNNHVYIGGSLYQIQQAYLSEE